MWERRDLKHLVLWLRRSRGIAFLTVERRKRRGLEEAKNKLGVGAVDGVKVAKVRGKLGCQLIR